MSSSDNSGLVPLTVSTSIPAASSPPSAHSAPSSKGLTSRADRSRRRPTVGSDE